MPNPQQAVATTGGQLKGPFRTKISEKAEQLSFELLSDDEKQVLAQGISFDPAKYEVYRFFILLESHLEAEQLSILADWSRRLKRQSLAKADRAFVRLRPLSRDVTFVGIHPTSRNRDGQSSFDLSGEILFSVNIGVAKLQITGKAKDLVKRRKVEVIAGRTAETAEWIFLRPYIESSADLRLQFCCLIPTELPARERVMRCEVEVLQGKRVIDYKRKRVKFSRVG